MCVCVCVYAHKPGSIKYIWVKKRANRGLNPTLDPSGSPDKRVRVLRRKFYTASLTICAVSRRPWSSGHKRQKECLPSSIIEHYHSMNGAIEYNEIKWQRCKHFTKR